jgi:signal transduction histidine kinase
MRGIFAICFLFMLVGFTTVMSWLFPGAAPFPRPQRIFFALIWLFIVAGLFRRVVGVFGRMQSRLQSQDVQRRHLMADIAHELRNPLAVLQGRLEGMLDGVYPRAAEGVDGPRGADQRGGRIVLSRGRGAEDRAGRARGG